ncbi:MAG: pseudouridine-5'-phosphate glycosidase [Acidobacteriota bacterium]|nr:MAG: pseudouridine-5'-phosphate glycosidase [Acidobacteriota bacterium]
MISIASGVAQAITEGSGVVALESTVIAHGLPAPRNLETAAGCESAVRAAGAIPATIGLIEGRPVIGLDSDQIRAIAGRSDVAKVNLSNLARIIATGGWGATTVAATLHLAHRAGIGVFATGGIGGVHRGAEQSFDISSDLTALATCPVVTVCAGAKSILDLPRTLEALETLGVPVVGYRTSELPAFYSRSSGLELDLRADRPAEIAALARTHRELGFKTAILVVVPVPAEDEVPAAEIGSTIDEALDAAAAEAITGKALTPFLLARIAERTEGRSLRANISLLLNNARVAGEIARALSDGEII